MSVDRRIASIRGSWLQPGVVFHARGGWHPAGDGTLEGRYSPCGLPLDTWDGDGRTVHRSVDGAVSTLSLFARPCRRCFPDLYPRQEG